MLLGGDEMGRTQGGNNNAYGQDNAISWFDWSPDPPAQELSRFTASLARLFREHPVLRRRRFFQGRRIRGSSVKDLTWYGPGGQEMTDEQWGASGLHTIGLRLAGDAISEIDERGRPIVDDTILVILNAAEEAAAFRLPNHGRHGWQLLVDTVADRIPPSDPPQTHAGGTVLEVSPRSAVVLLQPRA